MSQSGKKRKQQLRERVKVDKPNQHVLDSIGDPNVWTPEIEDAWLKELRKIPAGEIYQRFPPMRKPPNVRKRGKNFGWGNDI